MSNSIVAEKLNVVNAIVMDGKAYPEIRVWALDGKTITMAAVKVFLFKNGLVDESILIDPKADIQPIAWGLLKAFRMGILSLNATKQKGVLNRTPIRLSTSMSGKMKDVWAISTMSLVNPLCLARMRNGKLVCAHCYVKKSLYVWAILNYIQNAYILMNMELPTDWIPVLNGKMSDKHPIVRIESFGDLYNTLQAENYLRIVYANEDFRFGWWTKNPNYLKQAIDKFGKPENLATTFSMSIVNKMDESSKWDSYFDHKFVVVENQELKNAYLGKNGYYPCHCGPRSCVECQQCYKCSAQTTTAVELLRN